MTWLEFIRYMLMVAGLIYLVTQSVILSLPRVLILRWSTFAGVLVFCPSCSGFWIGILVSLLGAYTTGLGWIPGWLESGCVAMALGHLWGSFFGEPKLFENAREIINGGETRSI